MGFPPSDLVLVKPFVLIRTVCAGTPRGTLSLSALTLDSFANSAVVDIKDYSNVLMRHARISLSELSNFFVEFRSYFSTAGRSAGTGKPTLKLVSKFKEFTRFSGIIAVD